MVRALVSQDMHVCKDGCSTASLSNLFFHCQFQFSPTMIIFFLTSSKNFSCCKVFLLPHTLFMCTSEKSLVLILIQAGKNSSKISPLHLARLVYSINPLRKEAYVSLLNMMRFVDP